MKYRIILALVMILIPAGAAGYEYFQSQQQSQLQQEPISILKQFGVYDGNYSYVMFGSANTNSIDSSSESTATYSYALSGQANTYTITYATGEFAYYPGEVTTSSGTEPVESLTYTNEPATVIVTYSAGIGRNTTVVDFSYGGPVCKWQEFGNGPFPWSGCKQFVLMIYNTNQELPNYATYIGSYPIPGASSGYLVLNRQGLFYETALELNGTSIDWQFYLFYATYVGS